MSTVRDRLRRRVAEIHKARESERDKEAAGSTHCNQLLQATWVSEKDKTRLVKCLFKVQAHYEIGGEEPDWGRTSVTVERRFYVYRVLHTAVVSFEEAVNTSDYCDIRLQGFCDPLISALIEYRDSLVKGRIERALAVGRVTKKHRRRRRKGRTTSDIPEEGDDECVVCYEPLTSSSLEMLTCGHQLHSACAKNWISVCNAKQYVATCPLCRTIISKNK